MLYTNAAKTAEINAAKAADEALEKQQRAQKQAQWNAAWGSPVLPGGGGGKGVLAPGERIVRPEELDRGA